MLEDDDFVAFGTADKHTVNDAGDAPLGARPSRAWYAQAAGVFGGAFALGLGFLAFAVTGGIGMSFGIGQADARPAAAVAQSVSYTREQRTNSYWFDSMLHNVVARERQAEPREMAELDLPYQDISGLSAEPLEGAPAADDTRITVMGFSGEDQETGFDGSQGPFAEPETLPAQEFAPPKRPEPAPAYVAAM